LGIAVLSASIPPQVLLVTSITSNKVQDSDCRPQVKCLATGELFALCVISGFNFLCITKTTKSIPSQPQFLGEGKGIFLLFSWRGQTTNSIPSQPQFLGEGKGIFSFFSWRGTKIKDDCSCLRYRAYRKMTAVKIVFVRGKEQIGGAVPNSLVFAL